MRIGVSSQNFRTITAHAGRSRRFLVYETAPDGTVSELERLDLPPGMAMHDVEGDAPHPLDQLDVILTSEAGAGFVAKMQARGVRVLLTQESDPLHAVHLAATGRLPEAQAACRPEGKGHEHAHEHEHEHEHKCCCGH
ncbi:NifB/NifX family molybdenum-iron cluster-binding protein [Pararhodospirillum photometricum]|uniref:Nitrogen fixation-related protein n=1 Tax=Pararhodospirillum photometricum DSM 122 TaxID=1150469 RepID=H6SPJ1_PARPM|nr:NifB/NifX family molybdenum-iron cluster-binding protein [Pararhodospirillum photometricum]CCG09516.1 Nitrogen fixation-related protein [Pararhodospirillum photometricum DSM 122]